jgi:hypothetical protein
MTIKKNSFVWHGKKLVWVCELNGNMATVPVLELEAM